ncbi:MAG: hypothetical protein NZ919_02315, partial [Candidatus Caldarchaeum sp.]|nr:hypothetical protein [Candidatus Caldarchaeum sp.]
MAKLDSGKLLSNLIINRAEDIRNLMLLFCICAMSKLSLKQIISISSQSSTLPERYTKVFNKAQFLMEKWGYGQSETLNYIINHLPEPPLKNFFIRLKHAVKAGVGIEDFARIEYSKYLAEQENDFEKGLEKLKRTVEAYTTLVSVVSLLMVSFILVAIIFGSANSGNVMEISFISITFTLGSTTLIFATNTLRRRLINDYPIKPRSLVLLETTAKPLIAASVLVAALAPTVSDFLGGQSVIYSSSVLCLLGAPLALHGALGKRFCKKVYDYESVLPIFLKSFGDYLNATGSYKSAARMLVVSGFGPINSFLLKMETRMRLGLGYVQTLATFGKEMLSRLTEKTLTILAETLQGGARPHEACNMLSEHVSNTLMKDKRRTQITSSLKSLAVPLQAVLAAISALMTTLLTILSSLAKLMQSYLM